MFKDRWIEKNGYWFTKNNEQHGNGAFIFKEEDDDGVACKVKSMLRGYPKIEDEDDEQVIHLSVWRDLSNRIIHMSNFRTNPATIDEAKSLAEEYIRQLYEVDAGE